jgi:hypothetical protein
MRNHTKDNRFIRLAFTAAMLLALASCSSQAPQQNTAQDKAASVRLDGPSGQTVWTAD